MGSTGGRELAALFKEHLPVKVQSQVLSLVAQLLYEQQQCEGYQQLLHCQARPCAAPQSSLAFSASFAPQLA